MRNLDLPKNNEEDGVKTEVIMLAEQGLGFGSGAISTEAQLASGELTERGLQCALELVENDPELFVTIDASITDDGCGDGCPAIDTWVEDADGNETHFGKSYPRAKVFGGGLVVAASMWRAIAGAPTQGETTLGDREFIAAKLKERGIAYGGHSDEHAHGDMCGCGAIDKYSEMSRNVVMYREPIQATLVALYGDNYLDASAAIETVFSNYEALAEDMTYASNASGAKTMELMQRDGAVIKKLGGGHQEDIIILNDVEGTTFDQPALDRKLKAEGIDVDVQAFAVDVWRGRMYAEAVADIANEQGDTRDRAEIAQIAYADFLIRTLAVAATLTGGDLPVQARRRVGQQDFALVA